MADQNKKYLESMLKEIENIKYIDKEDIPNIDLYMDQVTTFMDRRLKDTLRNPQDDKVLTKTMINNYAKNKLIPSPEKKKYTKDHIIILIFIYYFKGVLTISDIQELLGPLTEKYFLSDSGLKLEEIYDKLMIVQSAEKKALKDDIINKAAIASELFGEMSECENEDLELFSFVSLLSFDVYYKKLMIEKTIDEYRNKKAEKQKDNTTEESKKEKK